MGDEMKRLSFEDAIRFHGHNGPFLAMGYRAGSYGMDRLKPKHMKEIQCSVAIIDHTPYSCIIDGIQCSTHCTIGKGNLTIARSSEKISMTFKNKERTITLTPRSTTVRDALAAGGFKHKRQWKAEEPIESLFIIKDGG
jgi:formylmethanofuran dehydrogenase subunit E